MFIEETKPETFVAAVNDIGTEEADTETVVGGGYSAGFYGPPRHGAWLGTAQRCIWKQSLSRPHCHCNREALIET
jgi:hypothetical protein